MKKKLLKLSKALKDLNHSKESNDVKNIIKSSFFNEKDDSNYKEKIEEFNLDNINTFEEEESESEEDDKIKIAFFVRGNGSKHVGQKIVSKRLFDRGLKSILENFKSSLKLRFETDSGSINHYFEGPHSTIYNPEKLSFIAMLSQDSESRDAVTVSIQKDDRDLAEVTNDSALELIRRTLYSEYNVDKKIINLFFAKESF